MSVADAPIAAIHRAFASARSSGRCALMPFVTGGFPTLDVLGPTIQALADEGADLIEVGFPFSDPIADGPVISASMHEALCAGASPSRILEAIRSAFAPHGTEGTRPVPPVPLVAMVSTSIVARMGRDRFLADAVAAGFSGFIVPDDDPAEAQGLSEAASRLGAGYSALVAPTTPLDRAHRLHALSTGFLYLLARAGVTGEQSAPPEIADRCAALRTDSATPIAVGFGISTAAHVRAVGAHADGAIVGSALVRAIGEASRRGEDPVEAARLWMRGLHSPRPDAAA